MPERGARTEHVFLAAACEASGVTCPDVAGEEADHALDGETEFEVALRHARDGLRDALTAVHGQRAVRDVDGADGSGIFPSAVVPIVPVVVVDANVLRKDVLYACRTKRSTVLVNAANAGLIRLFCGGHVACEVLEHHERWSREGGIAPAVFTELWINNYAPLLRLVSEPPVGLLTDEEEGRVAALRARDEDDVPSVALALLLGAFFLSEDGPATTAVYGERRDNDELRGWRSALSAGGDAGTMVQGLEATAMLVEAVRRGMVAATDLATRGRPGWLRGPPARHRRRGGRLPGLQADSRR